ncbi:MAG TPA: hypothetical protein VLI67_05520 [Vicinamibacteria bacterium]|nr:hypothetical protein [Vicinamibacteria bacterium]
MLALVLLLAAAPGGRPLFYWGARPAVIATEAAPGRGVEAQVLEVHAALDEGALVLRFTFDRPVQDAIYLPGGAPVSGRLRAVLYVDADADRTTGWDAGPDDLRTGAEYRLEVGVLALGADPQEGMPAQALVTAFLASLSRDGRRRSLWRRDDESAPGQVSVRGEWVELRLPPGEAKDGRARLVFTDGVRSWDGRLRP